MAVTTLTDAEAGCDFLQSEVKVSNPLVQVVHRKGAYQGRNSREGNHLVEVVERAISRNFEEFKPEISPASLSSALGAAA